MRLRNGTGATALAARATRAGLWFDFDKRHRAIARGTTVASSRRAGRGVTDGSSAERRRRE